MRREHFGAIVHERRARRVGLEQEVVRSIDPLASARHLRCPVCAADMETHGWPICCFAEHAVAQR